MTTPSTPDPELRELELWNVLDWSLWGNGLGADLRERMADVMIAAISDEDRDLAERLIQAWHERRGPSMAVGVGTQLERERDEAVAEAERLQAENDAFRSSRDQYKRNWDRCREANVTALETIADLRAENASLREQSTRDLEQAERTMERDRQQAIRATRERDLLLWQRDEGVRHEREISDELKRAADRMRRERDDLRSALADQGDAARQVADLRDELDTARRERDEAREVQGEIAGDRDRLSLELDEARAQLAKYTCRGDNDCPSDVHVHGCYAERSSGNTTPPPTQLTEVSASPEDAARIVVTDLHLNGRLGYVPASDEWYCGGEVLPDILAQAAEQMRQAGLLPEFDTKETT